MLRLVRLCLLLLAVIVVLLLTDEQWSAELGEVRHRCGLASRRSCRLGT
jgi:hypothetical protein